jgi:hypothetical protein
MLYEGQTRDGLTVIEAIRERYDGRKRNPFDEAECGHHYARAMAAWAAILALTGFRYSAVDGSLHLAAPATAVTWPWSTGDAWGSLTLRPGKRGLRLALSVSEGAVTLRTLHVGDRTHTLPKPRTLKAGATLDVTL